MKILAHTTGAFMLVDSTTGDEIAPFRPSVIRRSSFIDTRVKLKQIVVVSELTEDATDAQFVQFLKESDNDIELAMQSFVAAFGPKEEAPEQVDAAPAPTPKKRTAAK
jgi:hypothetical protein